MDEGGLPYSICTCPYERDCKHGVAVVIEYLKQVENNRLVPKGHPIPHPGPAVQQPPGHQVRPGDGGAVFGLENHYSPVRNGLPPPLISGS